MDHRDLEEVSRDGCDVLEQFWALTEIKAAQFGKYTEYVWRSK